MIFAELGVPTLLLLGLWLYCLLDVITTPAEVMRNLPKWAWVLLVLLLTDLGSVLWLVAGRPRRASLAPGGGAAADAIRRHPSSQGRPSPGRPPSGRSRRPRAGSGAPDDDPEFLRRIAEEVAQQKRRRGDADPTPT